MRKLGVKELKKFPSFTITAFHECYGSPLKPPTENVWRIGNVEWTGVSLKLLLEKAEPLPEAQFVWTDGLDFGQFAVIKADRYQKDLPLEKAMSPEVLLAYDISHQPLSKNRGGPVRLVVPGWFGTNMTKWVCRISLQPSRASGPFTTTFYNEASPGDISGGMRPIYKVEPNSMIVSPTSRTKLYGRSVELKGWAWSHDGILEVGISSDYGKTWTMTKVAPRKEFSLQQFECLLTLEPGRHILQSRAVSTSGEKQPLSGRRNHVPTVEIEIF